MRISTITSKIRTFNEKTHILGVIFWIVVWELAAVMLKMDILLPGPVKVFRKLLLLMVSKELYRTIFVSALHILAGFLLAMAAGLALGAASVKSRWLRELCRLPVSVIKATPVASFIILLLVWVSSYRLSAFVSFLMAFPIFYTNVCEGILTTDQKMLEMSSVFKMTLGRKIRYIYIPCLIPYIRASVKVAMSFCVKAGVAAEVIGLSKDSIGEKLYMSKVYFETDALFAWTIVVIAVSVLFTKIVLFVTEACLKKLEGR